MRGTVVAQNLNIVGKPREFQGFPGWGLLGVSTQFGSFSSCSSDVLRDGVGVWLVSGFAVFVSPQSGVEGGF